MKIENIPLGVVDWETVDRRLIQARHRRRVLGAGTGQAAVDRSSHPSRGWIGSEPSRLARSVQGGSWPGRLGRSGQMQLEAAELTALARKFARLSNLQSAEARMADAAGTNAELAQQKLQQVVAPIDAAAVIAVPKTPERS